MLPSPIAVQAVPAELLVAVLVSVPSVPIITSSTPLEAKFVAKRKPWAVVTLNVEKEPPL